MKWFKTTQGEDVRECSCNVPGQVFSQHDTHVISHNPEETEYTPGGSLGSPRADCLEVAAESGVTQWWSSPGLARGSRPRLGLREEVAPAEEDRARLTLSWGQGRARDRAQLTLSYLAGRKHLDLFLL